MRGFGHFRDLAMGASVVLGATLVGGACWSAERSAPCRLDDTYAEVVAAATAADGERAKNELEQLRRWLISMPKHRAFLTRERRLSCREWIRVEAVRPLGVEFEAVAVCRGVGGVELIGRQEREDVQRAVTEGEWGRLRGALDRVHGRTTLGPAMPDGAAYFVSFQTDEKCGQFALYAPFFGGGAPEEESVRESSIEGEKDLVSLLLGFMATQH